MTAGEAAPGRTYAVPFDGVWRIAVSLADGGLRGWRLEAADDGTGVIAARREAAFLRREVEVSIQIGLDENAQTRVDLETHGAGSRADARAERGAVARFLARLDAEVERAAEAARAPTWSS
jgi:hypothetical protein